MPHAPKDLIDDLSLDEGEIQTLEVELPSIDAQPRPVVACETVGP